ncbi:sodium-driven chloride bicarbonate exchanger-like [Dendroctonus ponderosae]|uniref:sodium-driven chloride bicarbonate exchanger-like n=1 Tax=Dendroctonus ponderosae TaxID=77166 RepID=UPI0020352298|nr:sodium-driven chloride bicarbonate exchanger-like [Dendroctonus ponderosae]
MDPHDDEAPKDPRVEKLKQSFGELDFEGHRAHSVFVGVHAPTDRRHSHRHKKHHKNSEGDKSASEEERPSKLCVKVYISITSMDLPSKRDG